MSCCRTRSRRGCNLIRDDRVSCSLLPRRKWAKGENALHEASERTEVEQVHIVRAQAVSVDPEALEHALDLIQPRIAACGLIWIPRLIVGVPARLPALACRACIATGLEPHGVEQRDVAARFGELSPHVEMVVDAPALGGERLEGIVPGALSSSMSSFRMVGGEAGGGIVACRAPPAGEDDDVAG